MDFREGLKSLAEKAKKENQKRELTEEATKMGLVAPMLRLLGYDVFDVSEVCPEYNAAYGRHKDAKVDYAILRDGRPVILVECKPIGEQNLDKWTSQLFQYFAAVPEAKFAILTNGNEYRFYTDLEKEHIMDEHPFLRFVLTDITEAQTVALEKFKNGFDPNGILSDAEQMKSRNQIADYLSKEFTNMDDAFASFILKTTTFSDRVLSQSALAENKPIVEKAFKQLVTDQANKLLKDAISNDGSKEDDAEEEEEPEKKSKIVTTADEIEAFYIVRGMLAGTVKVEDVTYRDAETYFSVLFQNNNRKPICRLWLGKHKQVGIYSGTSNESGAKNFDVFTIDSLNDLYQYKDRLINAVKNYV